MAEELTPSQEATVVRFGIFEPEEDDSFWEAIQAQRDPGPWVKLPTREALKDAYYDAVDNARDGDFYADLIADRVLALLSDGVA